MTPRAYATALMQAAGREGAAAEALIANLRQLLARNKQEQMFPAIAREFSVLARRAAFNEPTVAVAREADLETLRPVIAEVLERLAGTDTYRTVIDDSLIGGFTVTAHHRRFDASDKSMLANLYQTLAKREV